MSQQQAASNVVSENDLAKLAREAMNKQLSQSAANGSSQHEEEKPDEDRWKDAPQFGGAELAERPVVVAGKRRILREMMGPAVAEWMRFQASRVPLGKKGRPDVESADFTDYAATLIALCMYEEDGRVPVLKREIRGWGSKTLSGLFDMCEEINGLNGEAAEKAKKA